jgi:hypothetical protein
MRVGIGMPIVDFIAGEAFVAHITTFIEAARLLNSRGGDVVTIIPVGTGPHDRARQTIVDKAIEMGCDRLFMMDDDTITPEGGFSRYMEIMDRDERKPAAVTGLYLRRGMPFTSVWFVRYDGGLATVDAEHGIHELSASGLGSCLIDLTWCKENLKDSWFKMDQTATYTEISDDMVFFRGIEKAGGKLLGDADTKCPHLSRPQLIHPSTAVGLRMVHDSLNDWNNGKKA